MTKEFPLNTILTVTTGRLLTTRSGPRDNGIGDLYEILKWICGESPFTHTLGRFCNEAKPVLLAAFPELEAASSAEWLAELDEMVERHGPETGCAMWVNSLQEALGLKSSYAVPQLPEGRHESRNPVEELVSMMAKGEKTTDVKICENEKSRK